jgi:hypothetical protein
MIKKLKNNKLTSDIWCGQTIEPSEYYTIQDLEDVKFSNDDKVISDISSGYLIVNDGTNDIVGVNAQIDYIKGNIPKEVVTQFELDNKDLKLAKARGDVDTDTGLAVVQILVPGTPGTTDGRYMAGGEAFMYPLDVGDAVVKLEIVDVDNILGYGADTVLKAYHDDELPEANQGWFFPIEQTDGTHHAGLVEVETLAGYGFIPAGFYLRITAKKVSTGIAGTFFASVFWGKKS